MGTRSFVKLPTINIGYAAAVNAATPSDLASIPTLGPLTEGGYQNGQMAFVSAMRSGSGPGVYYLQQAISSSPDNFFVVPTADDPSRQWVFWQIQEKNILNFFSTEIDLTQPQTLVLVPPINYSMITRLAIGVFITQKDGTVTTGPTAQAGTDNAISNIVPSTLQTNTANAALNVRTTLNGILATIYNLNLATNGIKFQITAGAVLGTATVFKARIGGSVVLY